MTDTRIPTEAFLAMRGEVLAAWPTGREVNLEEAVRYQRALPPGKNVAAAMAAARASGNMLIQPRAGVALLDEHIRLLKRLETDGAADLLPTTIDAYTRQNRYDEAARGMEKSQAAGTSLLNGFPAVNHGVHGCRKVVENVGKPLQVRHGTPDARLLAEITMAAGFTSFEGGGISYNIPYAKKVPLDRSIRDWQYVDRLVGHYESEGVRINREPFGPLTGTLVPPLISHAITLIEARLALDQGVRSVSLGYGQGGNMIQDMAAMAALRELAEDYLLKRTGVACEISTVFHQWMGGFPEDEAQAFGVICWGAAVAVFAGADKVIVKTPHEAMGVPTAEANVQGLRATRQMMRMLTDQRPGIRGEVLQREIDLIKTEVTGILDKVEQFGRGDLVKGTLAAFEAGVLDVPFAPSVFTRGKVLPVRDNEGFIRLLNPAGIPLSPDVLAYHRERLRQRAAAEGREPGLQMVTDDIYAISKGRLIGRPR